MPFMKTLCSQDIALMADATEENKVDNTDGSKLKIVYYNNPALSAVINSRINTKIHSSENILPHPSFDKLTPPPDFS